LQKIIVPPGLQIVPSTVRIDGKNRHAFDSRSWYKDHNHRFVVLTVLQISIDDSRTEPTQRPVFVLAGYAAPVVVYEDFADEWQALLKEPSVLEYLKGGEAMGRREQFEGWSVRQRDGRVLRFIELIKAHQFRPIKTEIRFDDYQAAIAQNRGRWRTPAYFALVSILIRVIAQLRTSPERETAEFFFDCDIVAKARIEGRLRNPHESPAD
jgi:hypothetical protein